MKIAIQPLDLSLYPNLNTKQLTRVENLNQLKELASRPNGDLVDFHVVLAGGLVRSDKRIQYNQQFDEFCIVNEIDESYQELSSAELGANTILVQAIEKEALFLS